jgi:hypothetical protein
VLGDHFYEPIPNLRQLSKSYADTLVEPPAGVSMCFEEYERGHLARLDAYGHEFATAAAGMGYVAPNAYFDFADAVSLFCLIREQRDRTGVYCGPTRVPSGTPSPGERSCRSPVLLFFDPAATSSTAGIQRDIGVSLRADGLRVRG